MFFSLSSLWWRRIRGLWKPPDVIDWLRGILGLVLMGRAVLSKSWIQFSVDRWSCVPSLLFTRGHTVEEVMKIIGTSLKRSQACTATVHTPNASAGHHRPKTSPETPGNHVQVSCGVTVPFSWVLVHKVLLHPLRVYFPVLCQFSTSWEIDGETVETVSDFILDSSKITADGDLQPWN